MIQLGLMEKNQVILVTGVFDLLHSEHVEFLKSAKALGDYLIVGVESDVRVQKLKGEGRPIQTADIRKTTIEALGFVDKVVILPNQFETDEEHLQLLKSIKPAILAVSSHTPHLNVKQRLMKIVGGKVVIVRQHNPSVSTTKTLQKMQ